MRDSVWFLVWGAAGAQLNGGETVTLPVSHGTLYSQGVTGFPDEAGKGRYNGVEKFEDWSKRLGLTYYFGSVCPCNFGCKSECAWCVHDNRYPEWWPEDRRRPPSAAERVFSSTATEEEEEELSEARVDRIWDCTDDLDEGILVAMEPVKMIRSDTYVEFTTTHLEMHQEGSWGLSQARKSTGFWWHYDQVDVEKVLDLYGSSYLHNGFAHSRDPNEPPQVLYVFPPGIEHRLVWWPLLYNKEGEHRAEERIRLHIDGQYVFITPTADVLVWFEVYSQRVRGHMFGDVMLGSADGDLVLKYRLDVPRCNYFVYLNSNHTQATNYFYNDVYLYLCGPPTDPPMCRTHQHNGRVVNRVYGTYEGKVAPFVNRSVYEWDVRWEHEDPAHTNWDLRYDQELLMVETLTVDRGLTVSFDVEEADESSPPSSRRRQRAPMPDFNLDPEDPWLSYKLY